MRYYVDLGYTYFYKDEDGIECDVIERKGFVLEADNRQQAYDKACKRAEELLSELELTCFAPDAIDDELTYISEFSKETERELDELLDDPILD